jgi:hypothetical protein
MTYTKPFDIVVDPVGSKFAKALQVALQSKVVNSVYRRLTPKVVAARAPLLSRKGNVLRQGRSSYTREHFWVTTQPLNKVEQFGRFQQQQVSCPKFTTDRNRLDELESKTIFARTLINSTNGRGIVEFNLEDGGAVPQAPLYVAYVPKKAEYRFHVFGGQVIDVQEKRKKREFDADDRNTRVRNVNNGYVYCRDNVSPPAGAADLAVRAVDACGYKYGAVDLIYNEKRNQCYVLEVNSRPGLMGTTLDKYADALINMYNLERK